MVDTEGKSYTERLHISVKYVDDLFRLIDFSEVGQLPQEYIFENTTLFVETATSHYEFYNFSKIKPNMLGDEREIINKFIINNFAFNYTDRRTDK